MTPTTTMTEADGWRWRFEGETSWTVQKRVPSWLREEMSDVEIEPLFAAAPPAPAPDDLRELREAAERATPGPWEAVPEQGVANFHTSVYSEGYKGLLIACGDQNGQHTDDIKFIARANPSTVLSLIARIARLESENARLREAIQPFSKFAGIVFERNFNNGDPVDCMTASDGGQVTLFASDFFRARAAVSEQKP